MAAVRTKCAFAAAAPMAAFEVVQHTALFGRLGSLDQLTNHKAKTDEHRCNPQSIAPQPVTIYTSVLAEATVEAVFNRKTLKMAVKHNDLMLDDFEGSR